MRIVEITPSRVTLRDRKVWAPLLLVAAGGLMILLAGRVLSPQTLVSGLFLAAAGVILLQSNVVTFDKTDGTCTLAQRSVLRRRRRDIALDDITDLRIEPARGRGGIAAMSCRFALVAGQEVIPLTRGYEPGPERYRIMREEILGMVFGEGQTALR